MKYRKMTFFILISLWVLILGVIPTLGHDAHSDAGTLQLGEANSLVDQLLVLFGIVIFFFIIALSIWLIYSKKREISDPKTYLEKIHSFNRNSRLYILHIQGMSLTYGVRTILFNLYLLFLFQSGITFMGVQFDTLIFIGIVLAIGSLVSGIVSPFSGIIVDYIGKKWSFISGDFIGAITILLAILFPNPIIIIILQIVRSAVMSIHSIAEGPFIYEQSTSRERVHLFSVSSGMSTLASMSGNLIGGFVPLVFAFMLYNSVAVSGAETIFIIQIGLFVSVLLWLGSLIPALFMKEEVKNVSKEQGFSISARMSFKNVKNWPTVSVFVLNSVFVGLGAGLFVSFFSVFFLLHYSATTMEIAVIFALGALFIALGNFVSPLLSEKYGKVNAIVFTRLVGIPFMILLPLGPIIGNAFILTPIVLGGMFYLIRGFSHNATAPTEDALAMEVVDDAERTTMEALREAGASFFSAIGFFFGGFMMSINDFVTPFILASVLYLVAVFIFWAYFKNNRSLLSEKVEESKEPIVPA
jgi:MFS family permease